ncbi:RsfA family transcriptional regulator [Oceanobacillus sp. CAU 1775]
MKETRQDAWTKEEDLLLAETVLQYIKNGKTQLEAFKSVANKLTRTPAACGFRWNATIRKQYEAGIQEAKEERKQASNQALRLLKDEDTNSQDVIESAIRLLEKMKVDRALPEEQKEDEKDQEMLRNLEKENSRLKDELNRYQNAWREMGKLWHWVNNVEKEQG